jgi:hypothetical protein
VVKDLLADLLTLKSKTIDISWLLLSLYLFVVLFLCLCIDLLKWLHQRKYPYMSSRYGPPRNTEYRVIVENLSSRVSWQVSNRSLLHYYYRLCLLWKFYNEKRIWILSNFKFSIRWMGQMWDTYSWCLVFFLMNSYIDCLICLSIFFILWPKCWWMVST